VFWEYLAPRIARLLRDDRPATALR